MLIKFITGNKNKFQEVKDILTGIEVEQVDIDLVEIQSLDAQEIIEHKLKEASVQLLDNQTGVNGLIVEDTSLYFECFDYQLPGPFIKWFLDVLKPEGLADLATRTDQIKARGITRIGYIDKRGEVKFFEGRNDGIIVAPRGDKDFGWGPIFQPDGMDKTYGEMEREEKYAISMRGLGAKKLAEFLNQNN